ncbi:Tox-REase-5 domain-containing protein [Xanthomonas populi]|uniref:Tox-REase-5 domain-containing protein n=1 Tax=Xanthomonas populi TaxID=53414 RepID=A0A2S7EPL9_9XANT|nr:Tox-REase-5 domain-containing protein [Xanthomonas populi]PPU94745.1 hypothetical protein XpopCFBP1817_09695 [Xanthomonas populi]
MATAIPAGGRLLGDVIRGIVTAERLRKLAGAIPKDAVREGDCTNQKDDTQCNQCKLKTGALLPARPRRAIRKQTKLNYDYQLYIANLKAGPEHFSYCDKVSGLPLSDVDLSLAGRAWSALKGEAQPDAEQLNITEWLYNGVWFDGFWRDDCTVVDAKGRYAQFLDEDGRPLQGFPSNVVFPDMRNESLSHISAVETALPQAKVEWHFMEAATYYHARRIIPLPITTHFTPLPPV